MKFKKIFRKLIKRGYILNNWYNLPAGKYENQSGLGWHIPVLPSDEEIEKSAGDIGFGESIESKISKSCWISGAIWMRDKFISK